MAAAQASASKALQRAAERPSHFLSPDAKGALFEAVAQTRLLPMQRAWHAGRAPGGKGRPPRLEDGAPSARPGGSQGPGSLPRAACAACKLAALAGWHGSAFGRCLTDDDGLSLRRRI